MQVILPHSCPVFVDTSRDNVLQYSISDQAISHNSRALRVISARLGSITERFLDKSSVRLFLHSTYRLRVLWTVSAAVKLRTPSSTYWEWTMWRLCNALRLSCRSIIDEDVMIQPICRIEVRNDDFSEFVISNESSERLGGIDQNRHNAARTQASCECPWE